MRGLAAILVLTLCSTLSFSQHTSLPPSSLQSNLSPEQLQENLDSATHASYIPFHAKFFPLKNDDLKKISEDQNETWNFKNTGFKIRLFLDINYLPFYDTILIRNSENTVVEKIYSDNLLQDKWSSLNYTEQAIVEYRKHSSKKAQFKFEGYSLEPFRKSVTDFGDAGNCEVNVNCPEGQPYKDVERSVVRILLRIGNFYGWCTGSVMLTTAYDFKPYILTAEHCGYAGGNFMNTSDLDRWEFFFNYTSDNCSNPASESQVNFNKIIGADLLARSDDNGGDFGSDFMLVELKNDLAFRSIDSVFFAGWDRSGNPPSSGATIHHPQGDIKKVSTYSSTALSSEIGPDVEDTHWEVSWVPTATGHGVTEAGSSGCPLLDRNGLIHGVLTGGFASCNALFQPDYFGKFSYSWTTNGTAANRQLKPWLDPGNTGVLALTGTYRDSGGIPMDTTDFFINNLTSDTLSINGLKQLTEETEVQIFSMSGQLLYRNKVVALPNIPEIIDVSNYPSAMFIVRLKEAEETRHYKVVILNL